MIPFAISDEVVQVHMSTAFALATNSPDPSTQNGAVIQAQYGETHGWNAFPDGVQYLDERWERPAKYSWIEHAERNSIYAAAANGISTSNATMICPWAACADCARAIVQARISRLIRLPFPLDSTGDRWRESCEIGDTILKEGAVEIVEFPFDATDCPELRRDGQLWHP